MTRPDLVRLRRPRATDLRAFLERQAGGRPDAVSVDDPPPGYRTDHAEIGLGAGPAAWAAARDAVRAWAMFDMPWVVLEPQLPEIEPGHDVVVAARRWGLWFLNPARITEVVDGEHAFGFTYATLPGHVLEGAERFNVTRDADGTVCFRLTAASRLRRPLLRAATPLVRRAQARFRGDAVRAMRRAVAGP